MTKALFGIGLLPLMGAVVLVCATGEISRRLSAAERCQDRPSR